MKRSICLFFPILLAFTPAWMDFKSLDGRFLVKVPHTMEEKMTKTKTAIGELEYHSFVCQIPDEPSAENLLYLVSYCDYPKGSMHSDSTQLLKDFFDATIEESAHSIRGELLYSGDCQIKGYPGKVWRVDYNQGTASIRTKSFLVKNRLYTIQTVCRRPKTLNPSSDRFFDSFNCFD